MYKVRYGCGKAGVTLETPGAQREGNGEGKGKTEHGKIYHASTFNFLTSGGKKRSAGTARRKAGSAWPDRRPCRKQAFRKQGGVLKKGRARQASPAGREWERLQNTPPHCGEPLPALRQARVAAEERYPPDHARLTVPT